MSFLNSLKIYISGALVRTICSFFLGIIVAKLLGPSERGVIGIVMSIAMLSSIAGSIGLPQLLSINSRDALMLHPRLIKSISIALILSCSISFGYLWAFGNEYGPQIIMLTLLFLINILLREVLRGEGEFRIIAISMHIESVLLAAFVLFFYFNGPTVISYLWLMIFLNVIVMVYMGVVLLPRLAIKKIETEAEITNSTQLTFSITNILIPLVRYSPLLLMSAFNADPASIGIAAVAISIVNNLELIPNSISQVLLPSLKINQVSDDRFLAIIVCLVCVSLLAVAAAAGLLLFILIPFLGVEYSQLIYMFLILSFGFSIGGVGKLIHLKLNLQSKEHYELRAISLRIIFQFFISVALINPLGVYGVLIAISISQFVRFLYCVYLYCSNFSVSGSGVFAEINVGRHYVYNRLTKKDYR
jgi:O-antigen/teichoic acid export membrane protein